MEARMTESQRAHGLSLNPSVEKHSSHIRRVLHLLPRAGNGSPRHLQLSISIVGEGDSGRFRRWVETSPYQTPPHLTQTLAAFLPPPSFSFHHPDDSEYC